MLTTAPHLGPDFPSPTRLTFADIRPRDLVTVRTPQGQERSGNVQPLLYTHAQHRAGVVILNGGGKHGTPICCTPENFVRAYRRPA